MRLAPVVAVVATACGRFGFGDGSVDAPPGAVDASDAIDALLACPLNAHICDDFETGTADAWSGGDLSTNATLVVNGVRTHTGAYALDADVPPATATGGYALVHKTIPVQTTGVIAVREWVYALAPFNFFDEVVKLSLAPTTDRYMVFGCDNLNNWAATERSPTTGITDHLSTVPCVTGAWVCVETVYTLSTGRAQFYVDSAIIVDVAVADPAPQFNRVEVGVTRADSAGFHVHIDDVVIAPQRMPCQ
jgi:hypothetical protein